MSSLHFKIYKLIITVNFLSQYLTIHFIQKNIYIIFVLFMLIIRDILIITYHFAYLHKIFE